MLGAATVLVVLVLAAPTGAVPRGTPGKIAFRSDKTGYPDIYLMNADGSDVVDLTNQKNWNDQASWSPDGRQIVFTSQRDGRAQIYVMNADGSNQHNISNSPDEDMVPDWSPDGTKIAFRRDTGSVEQIWVMNTDGSEQHNISGSDTSDISPSWSPDGMKIAYAGAGQDIWTMNPDGSDKTDITNNDLGNFEPTWGGPDGHEIAFTSSRTGSPEIWVMNDNGSNQHQLTTTWALEASWAPDGSKVLYTGSPDGNWEHADIWEMNPDGSDPVDLTPTDPALNAEAAWQPAPLESTGASAGGQSGGASENPQGVSGYAHAPGVGNGVPACRVPRLAGASLPRARKLLAHGHCRLGTVRHPRKRWHKRGAVIRRQGVRAGTELPAGSKISVTLGARRTRRAHRSASAR